MKIAKLIVAAGFIVAAAPSPAGAIELVKKEHASLDMYGRAQLLGFAQRLDDRFRNDIRLYLFLRQARLGLLGKYEDYKFHVELAFAGEEEVRAPSPGVSLNLLDFSFDIPLWSSKVFLKVGQFKVPYSRENLVDPSMQQFAGLSLNNLAFRMGRDVGAALHAYPGKAVFAFGVFTGGGRDVPERFLPQNLGSPLFVARAGLNDGVDEDFFAAKQVDLAPDRPKTAAYLNALYLADSHVGHSTVLNVKTADKSLLINSNWNPFINRQPLNKGQLIQGGGDVAIRAPIGSFALSAEAEGNYGRYSNRFGKIDLLGGRAQVGIFKNPVEFVLGYAFIRPDMAFANGGVAVTGKKLIHALTPGCTYYIKRNWAKLIFDMPLLFDAPVVTEPRIGDYVLLEQPDQASLLTPAAGSAVRSTVARKFVAEARLLLQLTF